MILKFMSGNGWIFISDLTKVETKSMKRTEAVNLSINKEFHCYKDPADLNSDTWVKLYYLFFRNIGFDKLIVVDTNETYLLNDEGKTIERLN